MFSTLYLTDCHTNADTRTLIISSKIHKNALTQQRVLHFKPINMKINYSVVTNKIEEYPELKKNHKDHQDQPLAPQRTIQNSNFISENAVQMLLELQQAQCYDQWGFFCLFF